MLEQDCSRYWKTIIDTMAGGLMVVNSKGIIISVNKALEEITGYRNEELVGHSCEILNCDLCYGERSQGRGKYCSLFSKGHVKGSKCIVRKKDGGYVSVLKNATVFKDENGNVVGGVEILSDLSEIIAKEEVISHLRRALSNKDGFCGILGTSAKMKQVFDLISSAARSDAPVIIYGESGTGKELAAAAIHRMGNRREGPFIKVNCAALNESLLESELFGHVKGAFTGASRTRIGRFEAANSGDIFLDEIGDLPLSTQVKLLRVLQEKEVEKVGDQKPVSINVRIIAATHKNLEKLIEEKRFRQDLYYRIGVIPIHLPPLRERREDLPLLVNTFINRLRLKTETLITEMSKDALEKLDAYHWPGNVRELCNVIDYAFVVCTGGKIMPEHLPPRICGEGRNIKTVKKKSNIDEKEHIVDAMKSAGGNKSEVARILGISRVSLYKKLKKYGIEVNKAVIERR